MHDNLRQYRAIRDALTQGYPSEPTGRMARHVTTLAALISGLVASKRIQLPQVAAHMPDDTKLENQIKRFARWVGNSTVTEEVSFVPYIQLLLAHLVLQTLGLIMDGSSELVEELTKGQQTPTTVKPHSILDFPVALVP